MNKVIVTGSSDESNQKQHTLRNLRIGGFGVVNYSRRPLGRMAEISSYYFKGDYRGARGYNVSLQMIVRESARNSVHHYGDPSVHVVIPTKRYSKKEYWQLLLKLDPIAPELCAAFEADPVVGGASFKQRMQELFGVAP